MGVKATFLSIAAVFGAASPWAAAAPQRLAPAATTLPHVRIATPRGDIEVELDTVRAPLTTANFLRYVDSGRLNGEAFYRAMKYPLGGGLIQGGITSDARKLYPAIEHEPTAKTGLKHVAGTVSMANGGPGTAKSDFFIIASDSLYLDESFAAFGRVVEGMDVVNAILLGPTSATKGEGVMKGQMLEPVVKIRKAERVPGAE